MKINDFVGTDKEKKKIKPEEIIKKLEFRVWKSGSYRKQNWGNWLHRMSAYVGKIKPAIAHCLVDYCTNVNNVVLDPFCGIGTIPLEADLMGRKSIGIELNPYAHFITRAKFDRDKKENHIKYLKEIVINYDSADIYSVSNFMKSYYHPKTLKEIIFIRNKFLKDRKYFLLGCMLGILHGHRPGHLSATTSLVVPFPPTEKAEYREVVPRLIQKVKRMYRDGIPSKTNGKAILGDARQTGLKKNGIDVIISSPPYFNTLDYIQDNRLRLELLGFTDAKREILKRELIQDKATYMEEMNKVGEELRRILKPNSLCLFILGDLHNGKKVINTAEEIRKNYTSIGFKCHGVVEDSMPVNKALPSNYKRSKLDRFILLENIK